MEAQRINEEIAKWQDEGFIGKLQGEFNVLIPQLNEAVGKHCLKIAEELGDLGPKVLDFYVDKKYIDNNGKIIDFKDVSIVDKEDSNDDVVLNAGYNIRDGVVISKYGAGIFYNAYKKFAEGLKVSDRALDYNLPMSEFSKESPTQKEILYWCYSNDVSYEKFCQSSALHEIVHRWTMRQRIFDGVAESSIIEGLVEFEACKIADEIDMDYIPIFRHKEKQVAKIITENLSEQEMYPHILTDDVYRIINMAVLKEQGSSDSKRKRERVLASIESVLSDSEQDLDEKVEDGLLESFIDVLDCTKPVALDAIEKSFKGVATEPEAVM